MMTAFIPVLESAVASFLCSDATETKWLPILPYWYVITDYCNNVSLSIQLLTEFCCLYE